MGEMQRTTLRVAIIADNYNMAESCYRNFIDDNRDSILIPGRDKCVLRDGTIIEKLSISDINRNRYKKFDQALLCLYNDVTTEKIQYVISLLKESQVPQSYWFMCYEEDE